MLFCGVAMHTAIGTAAAVSIPVALIGTIGFVSAAGVSKRCPRYRWDSCYLPALAALVIGSVLTAPFGARAAHRLPVATLKRVFAGLLILLATKMLVSYW